MMDPKVIERLHNSQDFLKFLNEIHATREYWIKQLHDLKTESLQQISGRILAIDEVLFAAQYETLTSKWDRLMHSGFASEPAPFGQEQYQSGQSERSASAASGTDTAESTSEGEPRKPRRPANAAKRRAAGHTAV